MSHRSWLALALGLLAAGRGRPAPAQGGGFIASLETVTTGFDRPTAIAAAGDGSGRLFVTEKPGRVRIVQGGALLSEPFLDIHTLVKSDLVEQGLVGIAFDPSYASNGFFYVAYADLDGNSAIDRFQVSAGDPNVADPASRQQVLLVEQPEPIHNVNQLAFGPDGKLYIGSGDGGPGFDPFHRGQDLTLLLGKILRIDVRSLPYTIPPDNPFVADPLARDEIWAYGVRNPFRFSFDRETGDLLLTDVGQQNWEEVDFEPAGSAGGANYGWSVMEGNHCFDPPEECDEDDLVLPITEYSHGEGDCAIIGGSRYRGKAFPLLTGVYLFSDWCSGRLRAAVPGCAGVWRVEEAVPSGPRISAMGEDEEGEIYAAEWAVETAALFRVRADPRPAVFADGFESGDAGDWDLCNGLPEKEAPDRIAR